MYDGINMTGVLAQNPAMDWAFVDRLRKSWKGKFIIKGIDTREDARLCVDNGADDILVSNHGRRSTETLRATVEALPEVVAEVANRVPVLVDRYTRLENLAARISTKTKPRTVSEFRFCDAGRDNAMSKDASFATYPLLSRR